MARIPSIYPFASIVDVFKIEQFEMGRTPTVYPAHPFFSVEDAKILQQAFKGFGCDAKTVVNIITTRNNAQRQEIASEFKTMYGKNLVKQLKSKLRGNLQDAMVGLMVPPVEFCAKQLHKAISGIGTNKKAIIEVLGIHNNAEIGAIKEAYQKMYGNSLEADIKGGTSGYLKRLLVELVTARRDESEGVDIDFAYKDAQALLRAGELSLGADVTTFNQVLCQRSRSQLRLIFDEYQFITGHDFETAIANEFSGTLKEILLALVGCIRSPVDYLATRLHTSMGGIGTDNATLIRIVVSRSETDLGEIKDAFFRKYGKRLADLVRSNTSGEYKNCLLSILG